LSIWEFSHSSKETFYRYIVFHIKLPSTLTFHIKLLVISYFSLKNKSNWWTKKNRLSNIWDLLLTIWIFFFVNNYKDSDNVVTTIFVVYETHPSLCCLKALWSTWNLILFTWLQITCSYSWINYLLSLINFLVSLSFELMKEKLINYFLPIKSTLSWGNNVASENLQLVAVTGFGWESAKLL